MARRLLGLLADTDTTIRVESRERDWKCIECGHRSTGPGRPDSCQVCNCTTDDLPSRFHLFLRADAMDAGAGLVTGFRQFGGAGVGSTEAE